MSEKMKLTAQQQAILDGEKGETQIGRASCRERV